MSANLKCNICDENEWKYKCRNCREIKYCSQKCYSEHAQKCKRVEIEVPKMTHASLEGTMQDITEQRQRVVPAVLQQNPRVESLYNSISATNTQQVMGLEQLSHLNEDENIIFALKNQELRSIIHTINTAPSNEDRSRLLLQQLEDNPHFLEIIEKMMVCCGWTGEQITEK